MTDVGHNSLTDSAREKLRSFIERIENLEAEKAELASDVKELYGEAKALGYDVKSIRRVIALRKIDPQEIEEQASVIRLYMLALGMDIDTYV